MPAASSKKAWLTRLFPEPTRSRDSHLSTRTRVVSLAAMILLSDSIAEAIPTLNPHSHILVGFEDPAGGGAGANHHHWDPRFPLYPGNGVANDETPNSPLESIGKPFENISFDAYSAWDQRGNQALYRNGDDAMDFGHGFIRQAVPYLFEGGAGGVPAAARADFNGAIARWELDAAALFSVDPFGTGTGREFGMNFGFGAAEDVNFNGVLDGAEDVNGNGLLDGFTVTWSAAALPFRAAWLPERQELMFDSTDSWFFGGAGAIPLGQTDFFTVALHEVGHMIGLNHINTGRAGSIMSADLDTVATPGVAGMMGLRQPDVGALFGTLALYTQPVAVPVPAPSSLILFAFGSAVLLVFSTRAQA